MSVGDESPQATANERSQNLKRVLFVCLGNICRSPAAEGVMLHLLKQMELQRGFEIDSAGTSSYHIGEPADRRMRKAARQRGIELTSRARMVTDKDFQRFDLIVAMDRSNYDQLVRIGGQVDHLRLLSDFLDDVWPTDVPDPYFGGDDGFEMVLDMLQAACPKLIAELS